MDQHLKAVSIMLRASHALEDILKIDIESYGINTTEFGVLEYLYHKGSQPIQNIGEKMLMANSSMTYVIDILSKKKYVKRQSDKLDRRKTLIHLTDLGKTFFESIFPSHHQTVNKIFSVLSIDELNDMLVSLKKVGYYSQYLKKEAK